MTYEKKVEAAIKLLQSIPQDGPIEISYSTGKDSDVILELAKMSNIPFVAIYKNTTIDRPGSIKHAIENGVEIVNPKRTMLQLIEYAGWPSRWTRFCCKFLKEYKIYDRAVQGIRREESSRRATRYKEPKVCRVYNKKEKARIYFPILEWTNNDIERFIKERGIQCHPHYYDENGVFHVERRVGCLGCPLQADKGVSDFKTYPKMFLAWVRAYKRWWDAHPNSKTVKLFPSIYDAVYMKLFCNSMSEYYDKIAPPLFAEYQLNTRLFIEQYFGIKFDDSTEKDLEKSE